VLQSVSYGARDTNVCLFGLEIGGGREMYAVRLMVKNPLH